MGLASFHLGLEKFITVDPINIQMGITILFKLGSLRFDSQMFINKRTNYKWGLQKFQFEDYK